MLRLMIDGRGVRTRDELYDEIAKQLPVPDWFGRNLDALHDTLTCDILPREEVTVEIICADELKANLGGYADALAEMLNDIAAEDSRLTIK